MEAVARYLSKCQWNVSASQWALTKLYYTNVASGLIVTLSVDGETQSS